LIWIKHFEMSRLEMRFRCSCKMEKAMKQMKKPVIATVAFACATLFSFGCSEQGGISLVVESAQARVGRPLTPVSVAGVARRHNRRAAVAVGAVGAAALGTAAAVAAAPYYGTPYHGGPGYYAAGRDNGFVCQPGTWVRGEDGLRHPCQ
jgi:hypothetical protein